jgi:hypothetical protein
MSSEEKTKKINTLILRKIADKFNIPHEELSILAESEKNSSDKYLEMYTSFFKKIFKPDAIESDSVIDSKNLLDIIKQLFSGTIDLSTVTKGKSPPIEVNPTGNSVSGNGNATQISLVTTTGNSVVGNGNATPISLVNPTGNSVSGNGNATPISLVTTTGNSVVGNGNATPISLVTTTGNSVVGNGNATPISLVTTTGNSVVGNGNAISSSVSISTETDPIVDKSSVSTVKKTSTLYTGDNVFIETKFDKTKSTKYLNYNANTKKIIMSENPKK